jgi:hypothetical protein
VAESVPELPPTPRTELYDAQLLARGLEIFEREGLWLLLSLHHYGWRAHADMATILMGHAEPDLGGLAEHHRDHRAMAGFEELFLVLDQIWRLISGISSHRAGNGFLAGYRRHGRDIAAEFDSLQAMSEDDWRELLSIPPDDDLVVELRERGVDDRNDHEEARQHAADVVATCARNMKEAAVFFVRTEPVAGRPGRSLRDINNA